MPTQAGTKQSYSIMEAAKLSGLSESTLRYYESIGIIEPISRNISSKHRVYNDDDINIIVAIACLSATGMSISDMRAYIKNRELGAQAANEQISLLSSQKQRLANEAHCIELRQRYVDTKIAYWRAAAEKNDAVAAEMSAKAHIIAQELQVPIEK